MTTIRLPTEWKEFLKLLNSENVEYLLVGGYAVAFHGHPRTTADLDIWIATASPNAAGVRRALAKFGFSADAVASAPVDQSGQVIRMGQPPLRIELLTSISGVDFDTCFRRRETQLIDGMPVPIISRNDLLANKRAAGRAQDLADVEHLA